MVNLRLALRTLWKSPFVTTVTVISLGLGIGANTAIFSIFDQMLLKPLPVRNPGGLVNLSAPGPKPGSQSCNQTGNCDMVFSYPMFRDLEKQQTVFSGIAAHRFFGANLAYHNQTISSEGVLVSGQYFNVLGLKPALGRLLAPDDDRVLKGDFLTVLSYTYWDTKLGRDPGVLNSRMLINGRNFTIVGVAPEGFDGTTHGSEAAVFVPLTMREVVQPGWTDVMIRRTAYWIYAFARLRPGETMAQAERGINAIYKPIINDVEAPLQQGMSDQTMAKFRARQLTLSPGNRGQSSADREARTPLTLLLGITAIVLLIACANIANLLMARGAGRALEMAVRLSLGAGRWQLLAQLLAESCLLALIGGTVSLAFAKWTLGGIAGLLPDGGETLDLHLSATMLLFAALLSLGTGLLFGLFPALHSTRPDLVTAIRANTGQPSGARAAARFRTSLVTAQIALSMTLLTLAGLFVKSLLNVSRVDLGIAIDHVLTFSISPQLNGYDHAGSQAFFTQLEDRLGALPGVKGIAVAMVPLLAGSNWGTDVSVEGFQGGPDIDSNARYNEISAGYFHTLDAPLLAGRAFTTADRVGAAKVAIVNQAFAKKFHLGNDVVGKHMSTNGGEAKTLDIEIVGLMHDAKYSEVKDSVPPLFLLPYRQDSTIGSVSYYVRTSQDPSLLIKTVPTVVARLDPNLPVENIKTLPQQVKENVFLDRMISVLSAAFAALATLLAAIGLYGVLAYTIAQRTREIGVRMALGATRGRVGAMVLKQVGRMTLVGGIIGIGAALGLSGIARTLLFGVGGRDPIVILLAAVLLGIVALAAGSLPAARASRVEPMQALRYE